jgi:hypothetical protein
MKILFNILALIKASLDKSSKILDAQNKNILETLKLLKFSYKIYPQITKTVTTFMKIKFATINTSFSILNIGNP